MSYRKLSRAITVVLGAGALMAFPASATAQPPFEEEVGYVVECSGDGDGYTANVTLFQTTAVQAPAPATATLIIETSDGTLLAGETTGDVLFDDDGTIDVAVDLVELEPEEGTPAGSATVSGTYELSGRPTRVHEAIRDAGFIVVTTGTNTPLNVDLSLQYAGDEIALDCTEAFAFDLRVLRQPIGNNKSVAGQPPEVVDQAS